MTIVKFEDFQCPYCKTVQPGFRNCSRSTTARCDWFTKICRWRSSILKHARPPRLPDALATRVKFWQYHDKLYEHSPKASADDLKAYAKEIGLNLDSFESCYTGGKHKAAVQKDLLRVRLLA